MTHNEYIAQKAVGALPDDCPYFIHTDCGAFLHMNECNTDIDAVYCPECLGIITIKPLWIERSLK